MTGHVRRANHPSRMDLLILIDKLDDLIHNARPVPLTDQVRVDKHEVYDLLDRIREEVIAGRHDQSPAPPGPS